MGGVGRRWGGGVRFGGGGRLGVGSCGGVVQHHFWVFFIEPASGGGGGSGDGPSSRAGQEKHFVEAHGSVMSMLWVMVQMVAPPCSLVFVSFWLARCYCLLALVVVCVLGVLDGDAESGVYPLPHPTPTPTRLLDKARIQQSMTSGMRCTWYTIRAVVVVTGRGGMDSSLLGYSVQRVA